MNIFKVKGSNDTHIIDNGGNHFINDKCVNPTVKSGGQIGDTYPDPADCVCLKIRVAGTPAHTFKIDEDGKFVRL